MKREQEERDRHQHQHQHQYPNRSSGPQQYTGSRGSRGSGIKQQTNRIDEDRIDNRVIVNSVRQIQTNDRRNSGAVNNN